MPQIDITLKSKADVTGFEKVQNSSDKLASGIRVLDTQWTEMVRKFERKFSAADIGMDILRGAGLGSGWAVVEKVFAAIEERSKRIAEAAKTLEESVNQRFEIEQKIAELGRTDRGKMVAAKGAVTEAEGELRRYKTLLTELAGIRGTEQLSPEEAKHLSDLEKALGAAQLKVAELAQTEKDRANTAIETAKKSADAAKADAERLAFANELRSVEAEAKQLELAGEKELAAAANTRVARMKAIASLGLDTEADARKRYALEIEIAKAEKSGGQDLATAKRVELAALQQITEAKQQSLQQAMRAYIAETAMNEGKDRREKDAAAKRADFKKVDDSIQRDLNANKAQQAAVENDVTRTESEKFKDVLVLRETEIQLLEDRARLKREQRDASTDPNEIQSLQAEITRLNEEISKLRGKPAAKAAKIDEARNAARDMGVKVDERDAKLDRSKHYATTSEGVEGGLLGYLTRLGTAADQVAAAIENSIGAAVDGITQGIMGWVNGTMSFGQALRNIGTSILQTILQTIIQMGAQMAINAALSKIFHQQEKTETKQETSENALNAGMKSISQLGPIFGPLAFAAGLAVIFSLASRFAEGGIVSGAGTSTSDSIPAWLSNGEAVLNARATAMLGHGVINGLNAGQLSPVQALARPYRGQTGGATTSGAKSAGHSPTIIVLNDPREYARMMQQHSEAWYFEMFERAHRKA